MSDNPVPKITLKQPLGPDFDSVGAWLIIVSMFLFIAGLIVVLPALNDAICQQMVCR